MDSSPFTTPASQSGSAVIGLAKVSLRGDFYQGHWIDVIRDYHGQLFIDLTLRDGASGQSGTLHFTGGLGGKVGQGSTGPQGQP
jgi:hypothetical protein